MTDGDGSVIALPAIPEFGSTEAAKLWLSERFAREVDPRCILATAAAAIGRQLDVARVGYGEFEPGRDWVDIPLDWTRGDVPSIAGRHRFDPTSSMIARYRRGSIVAIGDTTDRDEVPDPSHLLLATHNRAFISVPLLHDGEMVALFSATDDRPRTWRDDEVALVAQTGSRVWGALQHLRLTQRLRESEEQFRTLAQNIPALCWLGDPDGRAYWANAQWENYFGPLASNAGDMSGFVHDEDRARAAALWSEARDGARPIGITLRLRGRDGGYRPFQASSAPIRDPAGGVAGWCGTLLDLSEREAHSRRQTFLRAFHDATRDLTDASEILAVLGEMMMAHLAVGQITYAESSARDRLAFDVFLARAGQPFDETPALFRFDDDRFDALLACYRSGRTLVIEDYYDEVPELTAEVVAIRRTTGTCASITVPLVKDGQLVALLSAVEAVPRRWTAEEIALVEELAERAWAIVSRARAEAVLQERERNQALLIAWTDRLRGETRAEAITATTLELLGRHLGVARATFSLGDAAGETFTVRGEWLGRLPGLLGTSYTMDRAGAELRATWAEGGVLRCDDVVHDARIETVERDGYAAARVGALVAVPLLERGRVRAALSVHHDRMRVWRDAEVQLLRDVAVRLWGVLERARTETELQERERHQTFLLEWTDRVRDEPDPQALIATTLAMLGDYFAGIARATFSEGDEEGRRLVNCGEWLNGVASIADIVFDVGEVGSAVAATWLSGMPLQYDDITTDPRIPEQRRAFFAGAEVRSLLTMPLIEAGRVRAALSLQSKAQRGWQPAEVALVRDVTERMWVALERARAEAELQQRERNQAFLIDWADRVRGAGGPAAIIGTTLERLGSHLGVTRVLYADADGAELRVTGEWHAGVASMHGHRFTLARVGAAADRAWHPGEAIAYDDVAHDARLPAAVAHRYLEREIGAIVSLPLVDGGRVRAVLSIQHVAPRAWAAHDVQLMRDVAERTWVALERARAQAELQQRERAQAFLVAWSDAMRGEGDARAVLRRTVAMLADHLGATRVNYAEPNDAFTRMSVIEEWSADSVPSVAGVTYELAAFGARLAAEQRSGRPVRVDDIAVDPLFDDDNRPLFEELGVRAALTLPMLRGDAIVAVLSVQQDVPRRWTDAEVDLVRDLADRTLAVLERAQSEARLAEREAQLSAFMDNAPVAMNLRDKHGRYIRVNPEFARAVGRPIEEITGLTPAEIFPAHVARQIEGADRRALAGEVASLELSEGLERKYGSVLAIAFPIGDGSGAAKTAGFTIDLTERRRAEAALAKSRDTLYQTEKLTALGSLLAGVSHELNNPLSIVMAQAVMMERQSEGTPLAERAQKIRKAADRCARIVQSFLAMARQKQPEREAIDLNAVVSAALELAEYGLRNDGITTLRALTPGLPPISADSDQLHQIVINLIVNAQQAMTDRDERTLTLRSDLGATPGTVMLEVADTGPGIPPEVQRRIFEPFYTTKPQGQGTGVGLSFSQGLAEAHGGTLELVPVAAGACFRLTLPVDPAGIAGLDAPAAALAAPAAARRALVIDDEREIAESLADFLSLDGFACELAVGGAAAKRKLASGEYDLIVSDLRMPDIDGPHLHAWMRAERPDLVDRIAFATGDTLSHTAARFLAELDRPVLEKPFTPEAVRRLLEEMELA